MSQRTLYLAAYDVRSPRRLRQCHRILRDYSSGGQKSVFECYLSPVEAKTLLERVASILDVDQDRFLLASLANQAPVCLGLAQAPLDPQMLYIA